MDYTLILRTAPIKGDEAYTALYALWPKNLIYVFDLGVGSNGEKQELLNKALESTKANAPFNGASKVSPLIPSYVLHTATNESFKDIAADAFRIFPGIETVYLDLGMVVNIPEIIARASVLRLVSPSVNVGLIASAWEYLKDEGELSALIGNGSLFIPCPLISGEFLAKDLAEIEQKLGGNAQVFCVSIQDEDKKTFAEITKGVNISMFVFWSAETLDGVDTKTITLEPKPETSPVETFVPMKALFTALIRTRRYSDAELVGHVSVGETVQVCKYPPNGDGTAWGKVILGEDVGYVVLRHFNQEKFQETHS